MQAYQPPSNWAPQPQFSSASMPYTGSPQPPMPARTSSSAFSVDSPDMQHMTRLTFGDNIQLMNSQASNVFHGYTAGTQAQHSATSSPAQMTTPRHAPSAAYQHFSRQMQTPFPSATGYASTQSQHRAAPFPAQMNTPRHAPSTAFQHFSRQMQAHLPYATGCSAAHPQYRAHPQHHSRNQHRYTPYNASHPHRSTASPAAQPTHPVTSSAYTHHQSMRPANVQQQPAMQSHHSMQFPQSLSQLTVPQFPQAVSLYAGPLATPFKHNTNPAPAPATAPAVAPQPQTSRFTLAAPTVRPESRLVGPLNAPLQQHANSNSVSAHAAAAAPQLKSSRAAAASELEPIERKKEDSTAQDHKNDDEMPEAQFEDTRPDIPVPPPASSEPESESESKAESERLDTRSWEERTSLTPEEIRLLQL